MKKRSNGRLLACVLSATLVVGSITPIFGNGVPKNLVSEQAVEVEVEPETGLLEPEETPETDLEGSENAPGTDLEEPRTDLEEPATKEPEAVIISFEDLAEDVKTQCVFVDGTIEDVNLPTTLNVTTEVVTSEEEIVEGEENSATEVIALDVTWQSEPEFDGGTMGEYIFSANVGTEYQLSENVEVPQITVTVDRPMMMRALLDENSIYYMDENGVEVGPVTATKITSEMTILIGTITEGWYYVENEVTIDTTLTISGDVKIILTNGSHLRVGKQNTPEGIKLPEGAALTIYAQDSSGASTGKLTATGSNRGIGISGNSGNMGKLTINGGVIKADGGSYDIGDDNGKGEIIINGGTLQTTDGGTVNIQTPPENRSGKSLSPCLIPLSGKNRGEVKAVYVNEKNYNLSGINSQDDSENIILYLEGGKEEKEYTIIVEYAAVVYRYDIKGVKNTGKWGFTSGNVGKELTIITLSGAADISKEYDGTTEVKSTPGKLDFWSLGVGTCTLTLDKDYTIQSSGKYKFKNVDPGNDVTFEIALIGKPANDYWLKSKEITVSGSIYPKTVTITPVSGQSKNYGADDPKFDYTVPKDAIISPDTLDGQLARTEGDDVNTQGYAYNIGNLSAGSNYNLKLDGNAPTFKIKQATVFGDYTVGDTENTMTAFEAKEIVDIEGIKGAANLPTKLLVKTDGGEETLPVTWVSAQGDTYNPRGAVYTFLGTLEGNANVSAGKATATSEFKIIPSLVSNPGFGSVNVFEDNSVAGIKELQDLGENILPEEGIWTTWDEHNVSYTVTWKSGQTVDRNNLNLVGYVLKGTVAFTEPWVTAVEENIVDQTIRVIPKKTVTINADNLYCTYDKTQKAVEATVQEVADGYVLMYEYTGTGETKYDPTPVAPTNAGTYKCVITLDSAEYKATSKEVEIIISQKSLEAWDGTNITADTKKYDGNKTATVKGELKVAGVIDGDVVDVADGTMKAEFETSDVGTGKTVTVTPIGYKTTNPNYLLPSDKTFTTLGTIRKAVDEFDDNNSDEYVPASGGGTPKIGYITVEEELITDDLNNDFDLDKGSYESVVITIKEKKKKKFVESGSESMGFYSPIIEIGFDDEAIKEILEQTDGDVIVSAMRENELSGAGKSAVGSKPVFNITIKGDKYNTVTDLEDGIMTVSIVYELKSDEKTENISAIYVKPNGKIQWIINSKYEDGQITFKSNRVSMCGVGERTITNFKDTQDNWAKDAIGFIESFELMSGTSATLFSPDEPITRGTFIMAIAKIYGINEDDYTESSYEDVDVDSEEMPYIQWATQNGIVYGIGDDLFAPDSEITREQMAVMMSNYAKAIGRVLPETNEATQYADDKKIGDWSADAVKTVQRAGIMTGREDNTFDPQGIATRGEACSMILRFIDYVAY